MHSVKAMVLCVRISLSKLLSNPKTYVMLAIMAIFHYYSYAPLATIARYYGISVTPWVFPFYMSMAPMLTVFGGLCILLFSDAPFLDAYSQFIIARCGRRPFIVGQVLYILAASFLFTVCMVLLSLLYILPVMEWSTDWGTLLNTLAQSSLEVWEQTGVTLSISVSEEFLQLVSPIRATSVAFLCMWLVTAFLGLVISFFNVVVKKMSGVVAAGVLVSLSYFAVYWGAITIGRWLLFISPVSWSRMGDLDWTYSGMWPSPTYAVVVLTVGIVLLGTGSAIKFCRRDLN